MESIKGIRQLGEDINDLVNKNNIEEDSLRRFKGMKYLSALNDIRLNGILTTTNIPCHTSQKLFLIAYV